MSGEESPFPSACDYCSTSLTEVVQYPTTTIDIYLFSAAEIENYSSVCN